MKKIILIIMCLLFSLAQQTISQENLSTYEYPNKTIIYYKSFFVHTVVPLTAIDIILENSPCFQVLETYEMIISGKPPVFYESLIAAINESEQINIIDQLILPEMEVITDDEGNIDYKIIGTGSVEKVKIKLFHVNARLVIVFFNQRNGDMEIFGIGTSNVFSYNDKVYKINNKIIKLLYLYLVDNNLETIKQEYFDIFSDRCEL